METPPIFFGIITILPYNLYRYYLEYIKFLYCFNLAVWQMKDTLQTPSFAILFLDVNYENKSTIVSLSYRYYNVTILSSDPIVLNPVAPATP